MAFRDLPSEQLGIPGVAKCYPWGEAQSPMESLFFEALLDSGAFHAAPASSDLLVATGPLGMVLRQLPVTVGKHRYRIDFAIVGADGAPWLACEVDGYAYHSSKDQVAYDLQRERGLTAAGWTVLRFTGGEVYADAAACVAEAIAFLEQRRMRAG